MSLGPTAGRASISGFVLALAMLLSVLAGAPAQASGGMLIGTLTGPDGAGFEYFQVDVYQADGSGGWMQAIPPRVVTSWDSGLPVGDFEIALPAGTYRACFKPLGYEYGESVGRTCWDGGFDVFGATDFVVAEGGTTVIAPRLPPESRVTGQVVGPDGVGIAAYVAPYRRAPNGTWQLEMGSQSLADGSYVIDDVDPGTYRLCVVDVPREFVPECWNDAPDLASATALLVQPDTAPTVSFQLPRRANIGGTVVRPAGSTSSIHVIAYWYRSDRWELVAYDQVEPDGTYRITGLDADTYRVCASGYDIVTDCWRQGSQPAAADDVVMAALQSRSSIDLAPGPAGFVTGTLPEVYLGAQGFPNVTAWRQVDGGWEPVTTGEAMPTGIGGDWEYSVGSLPTGTYVVCVDHQDPEFVPAFPRTCNGGSPSPRGGEPFEVTAGATTTGIDIATTRAGEISGRVSGSAARVRVDLFAPTGRLALRQRTTADGSYRFRDLPAGDYRLAFHRAPANSSLAAEWWQNRADGIGLAGATPVTVAGDVVTGISPTLDPGGSVVGRLLDRAGDPVAGCVVKARGRDGSLAIRRAVSDARGRFTIGGLSTARYLVMVNRSCNGSPTRSFYDADSPTGTTIRLWKADSVAVTRGRTTRLGAELYVG